MSLPQAGDNFADSAVAHGIGGVAPPDHTWWCHNCDKRLTACHCLEPEIQPFRLPARRSRAWTWLGIMALFSGLWWTGWLLPVATAVACAGAAILVLCVVLVVCIGWSEWRRNDVGSA